MHYLSSPSCYNHSTDLDIEFLAQCSVINQNFNPHFILIRTSKLRYFHIFRVISMMVNDVQGGQIWDLKTPPVS